jgi:hypothetical protein
MSVSKFQFDIGNPGPYNLLPAATTGTGAALETGGRAKQVLVFVEWSAGCSAGEVTLEQASSADFAGTWAPLCTAIAWNAANKCDAVQLAYICGAVRPRLTSNVVGGTVTVKVFAR